MRAKIYSLILLCALLTISAWAQDSINVSILGQYNYWVEANDVVKSGSYAYLVGEMPTGLRIVDVSDPATPVEIGHGLPIGGYFVSVNGNFAYMTNGSSLCVVNVADPAHPVRVGFFTLDYDAVGVAVVGNLAYVADGRGGLFILRYTGSSPSPTPSLTPTARRSLTPTATHTPPQPPKPSPTPSPTGRAGVYLLMMLR